MVPEEARPVELTAVLLSWIVLLVQQEVKEKILPFGVRRGGRPVSREDWKCYHCNASGGMVFQSPRRRLPVVVPDL